MPIHPFIQVKSIDGLCRFPAFGTLELGFNELEWSAVERLSHVTILNLTLLGNAALDSDPNCMDLLRTLCNATKLNVVLNFLL